MIIKKPQHKHIPALRNLWQQAFGDTDSFLDGFFSVGFSTERSLCLWENEELGAALYWFDCSWQGKKIAYLYGVATDLRFRGKGFCRELMTKAHGLLASQGYDGAILVPGSQTLFSLYRKIGYTACCPMTARTILAAGTPAGLTKISAGEYARLQRQYLPPDAVFHSQPTLAFVATFAGFYKGDGFAFCGGVEEDIFYFQEVLGNPEALCHALASLKAETGQYRVAGGEHLAMYLAFVEEDDLPDYFNIPMN